MSGPSSFEPQIQHHSIVFPTSGFLRFSQYTLITSIPDLDENGTLAKTLAWTYILYLAYTLPSPILPKIKHIFDAQKWKNRSQIHDNWSLFSIGIDVHPAPKPLLVPFFQSLTESNSRNPQFSVTCQWPKPDPSEPTPTSEKYTLILVLIKILIFTIQNMEFAHLFALSNIPTCYIFPLAQQSIRLFTEKKGIRAMKPVRHIPLKSSRRPKSFFWGLVFYFNCGMVQSPDHMLFPAFYRLWLGLIVALKIFLS